MTRAERLLALVEVLRSHRYAVTADALAAELDVSVRTIYRDIAALQAQGLSLEGAAGVGYVLRPGFTLPPLMFDIDELEALVLGLDWVGDRGDPGLARAAARIVAKVRDVLPEKLKEQLEAVTLQVGPPPSRPAVDPTLAAALRRCVREGRKMDIGYSDGAGQTSRRTIWPFGLGYFESVWVVLAWCELRRDLRHFRADRIAEWAPLPQSYPENRHTLLARWKDREGIDER